MQVLYGHKVAAPPHVRKHLAAHNLGPVTGFSESNAPQTLQPLLGAGGWAGDDMVFSCLLGIAADAASAAAAAAVNDDDDGGG